VPILGRVMRTGEDTPEADPVVVLSGDVWNSVFAKDPGVLGKKVMIQGKPHIVIGVMPSQFSLPFPGSNQVWTATDLDAKARSDRSATILRVIGLLKPGVRAEKAAAELNVIQSNTARAYASLHLGDHVLLEKYKSALTATYRQTLNALQAAVIVVWLIACINVSSLMLTRSISRRHEIILKRALGASGFRLARQALIESLVICLSGGVLGLGLGMVSVYLLLDEITRVVPFYRDVQLHGAVLGFLLAISVLSAVAACVLPVLYCMHAPAQEVIRTGFSITGISVRLRRLRDAMVVGQIALALVLLSASGLMIRTLQALHAVPLGFDENNVLTASLILPETLYANKNIDTAVYEPLLLRVKQLPRVQVAAISSALPMRTEFTTQASFAVIGDRRGTLAERPYANLQIATAAFPVVLGVRLIRGRFFSDWDSAASQPVAVVNQSFSTRYFMGADPLTFRLGFGKKDRFASVTVIGVMDDMKESDLARETEPEIYLCATQLTPDISFYAVATAATQLAVRTGSNPDSIAAPVRQILHDIAPDARVGDIKALHRVVEDSIGNQRLAAKLLELFAAAALLISLSGLYALLQFSVNQGIRDIGVRLAVGAGRADVIRFVVVRASMVVGTGLAIGVFLSFVLQATIRPYLFGLQAHGLFTILAVTFVFAVCGAVAAYLPARHAAAIEPMQALREQ